MKAAAHLYDTLHNDLILFIPHQIFNQRLIQLHLIKMHDGQDGHIGVIRPKVVQRYAEPRFPQLRSDSLYHLVFDIPDTLRDLYHYQAAGYIIFVLNLCQHLE